MTIRIRVTVTPSKPFLDFCHYIYTPVTTADTCITLPMEPLAVCQTRYPMSLCGCGVYELHWFGV